MIADHIRASAFLIVDGVLPGNEGRGYVLRRIIRRRCAMAGCWAPGTPSSTASSRRWLTRWAPLYPELAARQETVERALAAEEERFAENAGRRHAHVRRGGRPLARGIPGKDAFRLYDTYGFPVDLTADIARERGLSVDMAGFQEAMAQQREAARAAGRFGAGPRLSAELAAQLPATDFLGHAELQATGLRVLAILHDGEPESPGR